MANAARRKQQEAEWQALCAFIQEKTRHLSSADNVSVLEREKRVAKTRKDYGAFVEIAPGVEGLIHVSEMSWSQHLRTAQDFLKVGDEVEAKILTLEREDHKMSLGIKQLTPDPWTNVKERYAVGTKHTATVRNFTTFGDRKSVV